MAEENKLREGSYLLVRYVPDALREEFLNIGVFLHSPAENFLDCLFTDDIRRIKRFHPQADPEFLRELQPYFEEQIAEHEGDLDGYIREMQESFSNLIQVTAPRACLVAEPQAEMQELFARYVGARLAGPPAQNTRMRIKQHLTDAFRRHGLLDLKLLERRIPAEQWTQKGDVFSFDFGYRPPRVAGKPNGHVKLIHAYSLGRDNELLKALKWTFDRVLEKEPADLTVGHEDLPVPLDDVVLSSQSILRHERIHLVPVSGFDAYARSVRAELAM
jgi:hypothetical protein